MYLFVLLFLRCFFGKLGKTPKPDINHIDSGCCDLFGTGYKDSSEFFFFNWVIKQMTLPNYIVLRFDQTQKNLGNLWVHCFSARKFSLSSCCILELRVLHPSFLSVLIKAKSWLFRVGLVNFRHLCYANACLSSHSMWVECCPS